MPGALGCSRCDFEEGTLKMRLKIEVNMHGETLFFNQNLQKESNLEKSYFTSVVEKRSASLASRHYY